MAISPENSSRRDVSPAEAPAPRRGSWLFAYPVAWVVLVITLAGSWCPNCHDEAAFLEPLYQEYRAKGLEVVSLMFEHFGDFARAAAATTRFRQQYGINYTTLIAGVSDLDEASKKLPMLSQFYGFPTTIIVDRTGRVRKIHTGFSGPATGEHYTQFVVEFRKNLEQLLAEKGGAEHERRSTASAVRDQTS